MIIKWENEKMVAMQAGGLHSTRRSENGNDKGGYRFTYDGLNRLKKAQYLYGTAYHYNDYNEEVPQYDKNGNIMKLKRHSINSQTQGTGTGIIVDDLTLDYTGNQLTYLTDTVSASTSFIGYVQPTAIVPSNPVSYNGNGSAKYNYFNGIAGMSYNLLNLPEKIRFMFGHATQYSYDAAGAKRKTVHQTIAGNLFIPLGTTNYTPSPGDIQSTLTTDYCAGGHIVYENGALKMILNPEGYVSKQSNGTNKYNYYVKDYLGNNRSVFSASTTTVVNREQEINYYPFGMPYQIMLFWGGYNLELQPYKFGGKEYDEMHGLNWYDFFARYYNGTIPGFMTMDPLAEKKPWNSPYCAFSNNPINRVDPDGRDDYYSNEGLFIYRDDKKTDEIRIINNIISQLINTAKANSGKLDVQKAIQSGKLQSVGIGDADLSAEAYSNIFTDVLSKMDDVNTKELINGKIGVAVFDGNNLDSSENPTFKDNYNTNIREYTEVASHQAANGKSLVTASIVIGGTQDRRYLYSTVSNVQNLLGAHELLGHGIVGNQNRWWGPANHFKVYDFQKAHPSWSKTTLEFKQYINKVSKQ